MEGGYPVTGTLKLAFDDRSPQTDLVKDYINVTSDTSSSGKLSVLFSGFRCRSSAKMTDSLEFKLDRTVCPVETTEDGCTYTTVLESGTGSKVRDYSELDLDVSGTFTARCTDGRTGNATFSLSLSGFRDNNEGT